jgi:hypothetical protein
LQLEDKYKKFRNNPFLFYEEMHSIRGGDTTMGDRAVGSNQHHPNIVGMVHSPNYPCRVNRRKAPMETSGSKKRKEVIEMVDDESDEVIPTAPVGRGRNSRNS